MERRDLLSVNGGIFRPQGRGDQRPRRERRARARRRQPVQHQLPDRPQQRARRARGPLVRHDPPRREPGEDPARRQGRRPDVCRHEPRHLGQPLRHPVPRLRPRHASTASPSRTSSATTSGCRATFIDDGPEARRGHHRRARVSSSAASAAHAADRLGGEHLAAHTGRRLALARGRQPRRVRRPGGTAVRLPGAQRRHQLRDRERDRSGRRRYGAHPCLDRRARPGARRGRATCSADRPRPRPRGAPR